MFDEQPDGDPHGECAAEIHHLTDLVRWAYSKLHHVSFTKLDDALKLDEMKLLLEHNASGVQGTPAPTRWCPECRSAGVVGIEQDVCPTCDGTGKVPAGVVEARHHTFAQNTPAPGGDS